MSVPKNDDFFLFLCFTHKNKVRKRHKFGRRVRRFFFWVKFRPTNLAMVVCGFSSMNRILFNDFWFCNSMQLFFLFYLSSRCSVSGFQFENFTSMRIMLRSRFFIAHKRWRKVIDDTVAIISFFLFFYLAKTRRHNSFLFLCVFSILYFMFTLIQESRRDKKKHEKKHERDFKITTASVDFASLTKFLFMLRCFWYNFGRWWVDAWAKRHASDEENEKRWNVLLFFFSFFTSYRRCCCCCCSCGPTTLARKLQRHWLSMIMIDVRTRISP